MPPNKRQASPKEARQAARGSIADPIAAVDDRGQKSDGEPVISKPSTVRVVLVDSHAAVRDGLEILLERRAISVVGHAANAEEAISLMSSVGASIAFVDPDLPDEPGLHFLRRLQRDAPEVRTLLYVGYQDVPDLSSFLFAGADAIVMKTALIDVVVRAIRELASGRRFVDPAAIAIKTAEEEGNRSLLSRREKEVFDLLAQDYSGEDIAEELFLSPETIRTHIRNGMTKLQARTRVGAVVSAIGRQELQVPRQANDERLLSRRRAR